MKIRGIRPLFVLIMLITVGLIEMKCFGSNECETPLLPHTNDRSEEREFQNVYQCITESPLVTVSSNTPSIGPRKIGQIFVNTSTGKVYIATATIDSNSWAILN